MSGFVPAARAMARTAPTRACAPAGTADVPVSPIDSEEAFR
ncbi:hypothetical protein CLV67_117209 [Actinoplanes italicus]|uniref:Uncharacterized protein n=1 Tax=Actinoplanes italicus TaxID=113567 RepID=A0A2T0K2V6_9ACTN|nr:hypothetical protein CLV67_117209 [Actinoplanes italicus]